MKKLFLLLALAGVMVACGGSDSKKKNQDPEQVVYTIMNDMYDALDDATPKRFISLYEEQAEIFNDASESEQRAMIDARKKWQKENYDAFRDIESAIEMLGL